MTSTQPIRRARRTLRRSGTAALAGAASLATVNMAAPAAQADTNVWDRVADCESSGNWSINTGNGYYGGLQFWHPTWVGFGGQQFASYAHQATKIEQITIAQEVLKVQGPGAWPVCSVRAGLTMQNGLAPYPGQDEPAPAPDPEPDPGQEGTWWVSAAYGANIRSGPGTNYSIVGGAAKGTKITGELSNGWVKMAGNRYIALSTLTSSNPTPAPPPAPSPTPDPPPSTGGTWWVSASLGANIRSGPGTNYSIVGGAAKGTQITGDLSNGWVKMGGGRYIALSTLTSENPGGGGGGETPSVDSWRVNAPIGANVRSGPGTNYSVIGGASHGTAVQGKLHSNGWVELSGRPGWISGSILVKTS